MDDRIWEAGWNRAKKLLRKGQMKKLYLAMDADPVFAEAVIMEAMKAGISPDQTKTGAQLAAMAGVEVFTAILSEH